MATCSECSTIYAYHKSIYPGSCPNTDKHKIVERDRALSEKVNKSQDVLSQIELAGKIKALLND